MPLSHPLLPTTSISTRQKPPSESYQSLAGPVRIVILDATLPGPIMRLKLWKSRAGAILPAHSAIAYRASVLRVSDDPCPGIKKKRDPLLVDSAPADHILVHWSGGGCSGRQGGR